MNAWDTWDKITVMAAVGWAAYLGGYAVGRRTAVRRIFALYRKQVGEGELPGCGPRDEVDEVLLAASLRRVHRSVLKGWMQ